MLAVDVFPCVDGHALERSLFDQVLPTVEEDDVWIADRNFCTLKFLFGIATSQGYFIIREHQCLPWQPSDDFRLVGQNDSGAVFEQNIILSADDGQLLKARRVKVCLERPLRDGSREIFILTNLPFEVADALMIAQLYCERWQIETLFQVLTENLCCEINTLGYPKAALFTFSIALVAYNVLSVVKAALRTVHGINKIETEISSYYQRWRNQGYLPGDDDCDSSPRMACFSEHDFHRIIADSQMCGKSCQAESFSPSGARSKKTSNLADLSQESTSCLNF